MNYFSHPFSGVPETVKNIFQTPYLPKILLPVVVKFTEIGVYTFLSQYVARNPV